MKAYHQLKVVAAAALCLFLTSCGEKGPEDVAVKAVEALFAGDVDTYLSMVNATESDKAKGKAMFEEKIIKSLEEEKKKTGEISNIDVIESKINEAGDEASIKLKITYAKGKVDETTVKLTKVDGKWLLDELPT